MTEDRAGAQSPERLSQISISLISDLFRTYASKRLLFFFFSYSRKDVIVK